MSSLLRFLLYFIALTTSLALKIGGVTQKLMDSQLNVVFSSDPVPPPREAWDYYPMRLSNGTSYVCVIPSIDLDTQSPSATSRFRDNGIVPYDAVAEMHRSLQNWCFIQTRDWWTYKLCWNKRVVQYHLHTVVHYDGQAIKAITESMPSQFLLGKASEEGDGEVEASQGDLEYRFGQDAKGDRYVRTIYKHGTPCDLTKTPRETEIRLYCSWGDEEGRVWIQEVEVCRYLTSLFTRRACIPALQSAPKSKDVLCHRVVPSVAQTMTTNEKEIK